MTSTDDLSENELIKYNIQKGKMFKSTITLSAIYGCIALVLLVVVMLDTKGESGLSTDFFAFTVTFIAGMLIILGLMVWQILSFKPVSSKITTPDNICPDYWHLQPTPTTNTDYMAETNAKSDMSMMCVPDSKIFTYNQQLNNSGYSAVSNNNQTNVYGHTVREFVAGANGAASTGKYIKTITTDNNSTVPMIKLAEVAGVMYKSTSDSHKGAAAAAIRCDMVFPKYMAKQDKKLFEKDPKQLRCEYAKQCKITWTGVCPKN